MTAALGRMDGMVAWRAEGVRTGRVDLEVYTTSVNAEDRDDVRASLGGDHSAYARIVRRHQGRVTRHLYRFTRDAGELEELVQETFVQAYAGLGSFRGEAALESWLLTIATRAGYRFWKQRSRTAAMAASVEELEGVADRRVAEESGEALEKLLGQLPARDRLVLMLLYVEQKSVAEAAALSGWSKTMVKVQAFRARGKLRRILESGRK
jgi:RNA polymerase sigma-70 factor, ECF subfamily